MRHWNWDIMATLWDGYWYIPWFNCCKRLFTGLSPLPFGWVSWKWNPMEFTKYLVTCWIMGPLWLKGRRVSFGHVSPARPRLCLQPRASLITLSSDSPIPCVTQHLPQHCRLSSLAPSPHSTSAHCHWAKREGEKIHSTPAQCQQMSRTQTCRGEVSEHRGRWRRTWYQRQQNPKQRTRKKQKANENE